MMLETDELAEKGFDMATKRAANNLFIGTNDKGILRDLHQGTVVPMIAHAIM